MPSRNDIPIGRQHAISRAELCNLWKCGDRIARRRIADLRAEPAQDGYAILSSAHSPAGYWRSADPHELAAYIRENESRARSTFVAVRAARQLLDDIGRRAEFVADWRDRMDRA